MSNGERLNILALSPVPPGVMRHGTSLRMTNLFKRLSRTHRITLIHYQNSSELQVSAHENFRTLPCQPAPEKPASGIREVLLPGDPYHFSEAMREVIQQALSQERFDVVMAYHPAMLRQLQFLPDLPVVIDLVDEPALGVWREFGAARTLREKLRYGKMLIELIPYERRLGRRVDTFIFSGEADARSLQRIVPGVRTRIIPTGIDQEYFHPRPQSAGATTLRPVEKFELMLSGNMDFSPNIAGVEYFHREIFPLIRERCPAARWVIVGANPAAAVRALAADPQIQVTGFVEDLRPWFMGAAVVVSPLVSGGGFKTKVLEAWAMGKAVVATPLGCVGLRARDGENICLARTARGFAEKTIALLQNPDRAAAIGEAALQTVREDHSWETLATRLETILLEAVQRRRSKGD
jgi:glycosyltransferase involved in cell wall biosynthesis